MKSLKKIFLIFGILILSYSAQSQVDPTLIIDGKIIRFEKEISLPYWLNAGRSLALGRGVNSLSIIEFKIDSNNLLFRKSIHLTTNSIVPIGTTWKIESIGLNDSMYNASSGTWSSNSNLTYTSIGNLPAIYQSPQIFNDSNTWEVPPGVDNVCIEVWGAGGRGGGGFGFACFKVNPLEIYAINVGENGGSTSVVKSDGTVVIIATGGTNTSGGSSTAQINYNGDSPNGNDGGSSKFGGIGGTYPIVCSSSGASGGIPGGGASASKNCGIGGIIYPTSGHGRVKIYL
ncbi:hypothetical protein N9544_07595 [Flavobacteriales bacterium]|nr:hypothetical protein [Flavobacteriales bacterium]